MVNNYQLFVIFFISIFILGGYFMLATVVGVQSGVSKKGNKYTIVHYTCESNNVNGLRAGNSFVPEYIDAGVFQIGKQVELQFLAGQIAMAQEVKK